MSHSLKIVLSILFISAILTSEAQEMQKFFVDPVIENDSSKFNLQIDNTNFLKNNEYFNPFVEGYTLIGYWLKPQVTFNAGPKLSLSGGFHAQKYSGVDAFSEFKPVFSINYKTGKYSNLIFGNLSGTVNHNIGDFLLADEYYLTDNIENGLQFIHKSKRFESDTWIDWKQFIFQGSEYPEILLFGSSNTITLFNNSNNKLNLRLSGVASHVGGQIDNSDTNVQTIMNSQTGIDYYIIQKNSFINQIRLFGHYYTSLDQSPTKSLKYIYGFGINSGAEFSHKLFDLRIEHWYGEYFFTKFGNQMFNSFNIENPKYAEGNRAFVKTHLFCKYQPAEYMKMGLGVNIFYDLYNQQVDYSMGFYIKTHLNFKLTKV